MKISLPKQAEDHFNEEIEKFLFLLRPAPDHHEQSRPKLSGSHRVSISLSAETNSESTGSSGAFDGFGHQISKYFQSAQGPIGLVD